MLNKIFKIDFQLFLPLLILLSLGLLILGSLTVGGNQGFGPFWRQLVFILISFVFYVIFSNIDYQIFRNFSLVTVLIYLAGISSLFLVLVMGKITRGITG